MPTKSDIPVIDRSQASFIERVVYAVLYIDSNATIPTIAAACSINLSNVRKAMRRLRAIGVLRTNENGKREVIHVHFA